MWSIKGTTAGETVTSGSSDPVLIPMRFYIQSASTASELSNYQARLIWDAAALHLLGSYRSQCAPAFPRPCQKLLLTQHAVVVMFLTSPSELPPCARCSALGTALCPTGSCSSASGGTILFLNMFLDPLEKEVAL